MTFLQERASRPAMKAFLQLIGVLVLVLAGLAGVLVARTLLYPQPAPATADATVPDVAAFDPAPIAARLSEAVRIRTITLQPGDPQPGMEAPWTELHAFLEASYPRIHAELSLERIAGLTLKYVWEGANPDLAPIVLMAHQDVVPVNLGTADDWLHPPFEGAIADGYVWGRGTMDDKASMIAILEAVERLLAEGFRPERPIHLLFGHDEEVQGSGVRTAAEAYEAAGVRPYLVLDEGFSTIERFPLTGKPASLIGVSEKGYMTVRLTAPAQGGHSSIPPRESGAVRIARAVVALEETQRPLNLDREPVQAMLKGSAADMPFLTRLAIANAWLFGPFIDAQLSASGPANAVMRTTTAPTMLEGSVKENVLPQRASAVVNFRLHPADSPEDVLVHVQRLVGPYEVEVEIVGAPNPASPVTPTDGAPWAAMAGVAKGVAPEAPILPGLVLGATDARYFANRAEAVFRYHPAIYNDADIAGFHGTNERMAVENLARMAEGYTRLILIAAGPETSR